MMSVKTFISPPCFSPAGIANTTYIQYNNMIVQLNTSILAIGDYIYGVYEILPQPNGTTPGYAAFTSQKPIGDIRDMDSLTGAFTASIAYNKTDGYIRYMINGAERFRVTGIGQYPDMKYVLFNYGGTPTTLTLSTLNNGYGMFSGEGIYIDCNGIVHLSPGVTSPQPCYISGNGGQLHLIQEVIYTSTYIPEPPTSQFTALNTCNTEKKT